MVFFRPESWFEAAECFPANWLICCNLQPYKRQKTCSHTVWQISNPMISMGKPLNNVIVMQFFSLKAETEFDQRSTSSLSSVSHSFQFLPQIHHIVEDVRNMICTEHSFTITTETSFSLISPALITSTDTEETRWTSEHPLLIVTLKQKHLTTKRPRNMRTARK